MLQNLVADYLREQQRKQQLYIQTEGGSGAADFPNALPAAGADPNHQPGQAAAAAGTGAAGAHNNAVAYIRTRGVVLTFEGTVERDVTNCSAPFYLGGVKHLFGKVERRSETRNANVYLFRETAPDTFTLLEDEMCYQLEDPFFTCLAPAGRAAAGGSGAGGEVRRPATVIMGGTRIIKNAGLRWRQYCDFYQAADEDPEEAAEGGSGLSRLLYFTSGPNDAKYIRLVPLRPPCDGKNNNTNNSSSGGGIGVFARNRGPDGKAQIAFTTIATLADLSTGVIERAAAIHAPEITFPDTWSGVSQAYLLTSGKIGCLSHHGFFRENSQGEMVNTSCSTAFVFDPATRTVCDFKILAHQRDFPPGSRKLAAFDDYLFSSGLLPVAPTDAFPIERGREGLGECRPDAAGRTCVLYCGLRGTTEGRIVVDYPFEGHGDIEEFQYTL